MIKATVGDLYDRCVKHYSDRTAIRFGTSSLTYGDMAEGAYRLANALTRMGIKKGDRVALLMPNCPEYIFCEYALAKLGAVKVPLAALLSPSDHVYMMNFAECRLLIYHARMVQRVREMIPRLETAKSFIRIDDGEGAHLDDNVSMNEVLATHSPDVPQVAITPDDLCGIYFTGGTTGRPKGVMLSHRSWMGTYLTEMLELGLGYDEVFAFVTPMTHASGCLILPLLLRRGVGVILDHFEPKLLLEAIHRERVTSTFVVPTMIYMLLDYPDLRKYDFSSLRNIVYGASAIAPERLKQALSIFGPVFTQLYGQTEAPNMISVLPREEHIVPDTEEAMRVLGSCGRPTLPAKVRIVDDRGRDVASGDVGEIVVQHSNLMDGYLDNPEATAATVRDGWLHTGDLARQDDRGFLYIVDRSKDMIVSGGFNVYPREIEDVLHEHPAVKNVAVVGVPDQKWGEAVKAVVVLHEGASADEQQLIQFVKERKGSLVAPKSVEFWEAIPLTNLGKIDKKVIRDRFWQGQERRV